jgi:hypothetical protein
VFRASSPTPSTVAEQDGSNSVSTHNLLTLLEGLDVFASMALMALACGLKMMISAREGESGWAWFWALVFVMASLLADLTFLRLM